jgi:pyocin large subunit-like protein
VFVLLALFVLALASGCGAAVGASDGRAGAEPRAAKPTATVATRAAPAADVDGERERYTRASWAPGQLGAHFDRHGEEGPYRSAAEYDAAARETIRLGTAFRYVDRESDAERLGFYDKAANRFTGLTRDGQRITTHFRPNRGENYVRGLERSTYR